MSIRKAVFDNPAAKPFNPPWPPLIGGYGVQSPEQVAKRFAPAPAPVPSAFAEQVGGSHYQRFAIQPADFIMSNGIPWAEASALQYIVRWRDKGGTADLRKAIHTLQLLIEHEEKRGGQ